MDKRYQIFISSTYNDLEEERLLVFQTITKMDHIPAGMELFPAIDEEQFEYIKKIIDDSDYYIIIVAGRYGTISSDGLSYTEKEYDYAVSKGIKVLAFVHSEPRLISFEKSEQDPLLRAKFQKFIEKVKSKRLLEFWKTKDELPALIALSLPKTIKTYPAVGWVRGDTILGEAAKEINYLNGYIKQLKIELEGVRNSVLEDLKDYASGDDEFVLRYNVQTDTDIYGSYETTKEKIITTWNDIFRYISPYVKKNGEVTEIRNYLNVYINVKAEQYLQKYNTNLDFLNPWYVTVDEDDLKTITVQLTVLGLIKVSDRETWSLTSFGEKMMVNLRAIKKANNDSVTDE